MSDLLFCPHCHCGTSDSSVDNVCEICGKEIPQEVFDEYFREIAEQNEKFQNLNRRSE